MTNDLVANSPSAGNRGRQQLDSFNDCSSDSFFCHQRLLACLVCILQSISGSLQWLQKSTVIVTMTAKSVICSDNLQCVLMFL